MKPNSRESPKNSVATEILNSEDDEEGESGSGEEEEQLVAGTPTAALCEQVVPLLRYLDRKAVDKLRDEKLEEAKKGFAKEKAKLVDELDSEQIQNRILS
ncbi:hypothetical protein AXG93_2923s1000 [Marchantia polymorpha subsp. ruderalis]|uniref:Uncharacterized protein n=1 Tax=Marchantia polymorpha subsp. ruderalis TaxID=1480154 RepID=A0A176W306_MARPO|nr:hypothetical protein AXG93_2923s1000 [Marchantia polymorpha subsp. ruderalis]